MNRVALDLGFIQIYWYSIFIFLAALAACTVIYLESKKRGIDKDFVINLAFSTIIWGIIGARIYYVLFNLDYYLSNPIEILEIWNGGLAIHGGMIAGTICVILNCKKYGVDTLQMTDIIVVGLILGQAIGRWGNFFNSEAHGFATTYTFLQKLFIPEFIVKGMYIGGVYYLPTFYFESLWCLLGFIILLIIRRFKYIKVGTLTCVYLMWYSFGRFFIEAWRTDSLMIGGFKMAQIISIALFIIALIYLIYLYHKGKYENLYNDINKGRVL